VLTGCPLVVADAGVENVNAHVDELIATGVLGRLLAFTELKFSNSMIDAWWRSLKHHWLFLHSLDSVATIRRLVAFYVQEHNHVLPHSAFRGQTPDAMYFGTGDRVPANLMSGAGRRAQGTRRGQPVGILPGVPVTQRRVTRRLTRRRDRELDRLEVIAERTRPRACYERARTVSGIRLPSSIDGALPS
jgi:Integrase core domain